MSAIKLSLYFYRVFAVVVVSYKLYLVAQEVDFKTRLPFPIHINCVTAKQRLDVSVTKVFACHDIIWLQFRGAKMRNIVNSNFTVLN